MELKYVEVAVGLPIFKTFHYRVPQKFQHYIEKGSQVLVPFKNQKLLGVVIDFPRESSAMTKDILDANKAIFSPKMLEFLRWISSHYGAPLGEVIKAALPPHTFPTAPKKTPEFPHLEKFLSKRPVQLTGTQISILNVLEKALHKRQFHPFLLHGVTGSGKTEIYLHIIKKALLQKKECPQTRGSPTQAIVLVPEISLTPQLLSRFEDYFPNQIAVLHSRLTPKERAVEWLKIKNKDASIVIGARSAIFAPFENVGVIVVDEEQDTSFKQEEHLRYHGRDLALVRGKFENALVILGSATPSLESYFNSEQKKIQRLLLPERIHGQPLPKIDIVDLKNTGGSSTQASFGKDFIFSNALLYALEETLYQKEQAILLLNRRGYASFLLCQNCGYVVKCPHCSVSLTVYTNEKKLMCHYCSHTKTLPSFCPDCGNPKIFSFGIGTEKIEEELQKYFPQAIISRMDRTSTRKKDAFHKILTQFSNQKSNILIGTQMVAKGHDFPNVTLSGVILADISLNVCDFRAPERTFQLLTQLAGRAGRDQKKGRVIIQTFQPTHYAITFAKNHDYVGFYKKELELRRELKYPPFSKLLHFKIASANEKKAREKIKNLFTLCEEIKKKNSIFSTFEFLGPAPSPLFKIKDKYRFHILLKSPSYQLIRLFFKDLFLYEEFLYTQPVVQIDVDPLNLA